MINESILHVSLQFYTHMGFPHILATVLRRSRVMVFFVGRNRRRTILCVIRKLCDVSASYFTRRGTNRI